MRFRVFLVLLIVSAGIPVFSQSAQSEFIEARRLLSESRYSDAASAFLALEKDPVFGRLAQFYSAFSMYKGGSAKAALAKWENQLAQSGAWRGRPELLFWLAYGHLEAGLYDQGISYSERLTEETYSAREARGLIETFLRPLSAEQLKSLYASYPQNQTIGDLVLEKESQKPFADRDALLVRSLMDRARDEQALSALPTQKREVYRVAVILPFIIDKTRPEQVLQNQLVTGLYQGMQIGQTYLDSVGVKLELAPYDTRRDERTTRSILEKLPEETDLIIGPLYPEPISSVSTYSKTNKVNMINPVSSNSEVIADNPFAFLFKPAYETIATQLARYSTSTFTNRNVMIFYENNQRDSLIAALYRALVEQDSFKVVWFQEINNVNAKSILDTLTAQYEVYYTKAEADSLLLLSGRFVKERRLRPDELKRINAIKEGNTKDSTHYKPVTIREADGKEVTYYENFFYIGDDSIGHIFGATRNNALVNNLISAVETKGNNIGLLGYGEWIDFTMLSYNQLERIGVVLAHPDFANPEDPDYQKFAAAVRKQYLAEPTLYQLLGFELIVQVGNLLKTHGVYFQNGLRDGAFYPGTLLQGMRYGSFNDNQVVPLVQFQGAKLVPITPSK